MPPASQLAMWGVTEDDHVRPEVSLWPENWPAIRLFTELTTQWRVGMNGPTGLDYNVVFHELDRTGLAGEAYDEMMAAVRVIESTALDEIHKANT